MKGVIRNRPIVYSIILAMLTSILWGASAPLVRIMSAKCQDWVTPLLLIAVNVMFFAIAAILLGKVNGIDGFRHIFKIEGITKGILAIMPVAIFFAFTLIANIDSISGASVENPAVFSLMILVELVSSLVQNTIFRGLLTIALLIKHSTTKSERVKSIFKAPAMYLFIIYIPANIINTGSLNFMQLVNTFIVGAGLCAAYLYSKNLMSLVLIQGIWQALGYAINALGLGSDNQLLAPPAAIAYIVILILIVVFSVIFARRAEPFVLDGEMRAANKDNP